MSPANAAEMSELQDELSLRLSALLDVDLGVEDFLWARGEPGAMAAAAPRLAELAAVVLGELGTG